MFPASDLRKLWLVEPHPALRIRAGFAHRLLLKLPKPRVHLFPEQNEIKGCSICSGGHHCLRANVKDWKSPTKGIQGVNAVRISEAPALCQALCCYFYCHQCLLLASCIFLSYSRNCHCFCPLSPVEIQFKLPHGASP